MWKKEIICSINKPETVVKLNETSYIYRKNITPMYDDNEVLIHWTALSKIVETNELNEIVANSDDSVKETLDAIMYALADIYEKLGVK